MNASKLCAFAIGAVLLILVIRQLRPELASLTALATCLFLMACILADFLPAVRFLREMMEKSGFGAYLTVMVKALGIGLLTQTATDICRDAGEQAIAGQVELAGKAEILLLCLPLLDELLGFAKQLFGVAS